MSATIRFLLWSARLQYYEYKQHLQRLYCMSFNSTSCTKLLTITKKKRCFQITNIKPQKRSYGDGGSSSGLYRGIMLSLGLFGLGSQDNRRNEYKAATEKLAKTDKVTLLLKHAKLEERKQNYQEAESYYHQALAALKIFQQQKTWKDDKILDAHIFIYSGMANLAMARLQFTKAEDLFKEMMRGLLQKGLQQDDNALVEISLKLSMIYAIQKRNFEAESGYKFCIETQGKKLFDADSPADDNAVALFGLCVDSYSRYLLVQQKYPEAEEKLKQALQIAIQVHGQYHPQVAVLRNDIATVQSLQDDYTQAKINIQEAVTVAERTQSPDLPTFMCNLGLVCLHQMLFEEANRHCSQALKLARKAKHESAETEALKCLKSVKQAKKLNIKAKAN